MLAAATAGAVTAALWEAYIAALDALFTRYQGGPPRADEVLAAVRTRSTGERGATISIPRAFPGIARHLRPVPGFL